jgi:integrase
MGILAECPACHTKQSRRNKKCVGWRDKKSGLKCKENLDDAKKTKKVRYWISYRMPNGKQRKEAVGAFKGLDPTSITDAKDALSKRQVQKRERRIFDMLPESEMTFDELAKWYLNLKSVRKLVSFDRYEDALNNFAKVFGRTFLGDIKQTDLEEYQIERKGQGVADATVDYEIKIAQAAVNKAFDNDKVDGACLKAFRRTKRLLKFGANARNIKVTVEQYLKLLDHAPPYYRPVLIVAYNTGMRKGEIKNLRWSHIDWKNMMIRLPKEVTKEGKPKSIPINHHVQAVLDKLPRTIHDYVITYKGRPMTGNNNLRSQFPRACKKAKIPYGRKQAGGITFHDIRTAVKSYMEEAGVGEARRDAILGHSKKGMDAHYLFVSDESLRQGMDQYTAWLDNQIDAPSQSVAHSVAQEAV